MSGYLSCLTPALMLFATLSYGELSVRIVDAPSSTLVYSPIYVTGELINNGPEPVFLAVRGTTGGCFVEISHSNSPLPSYMQDDGTGIGDELRQLGPGQRYLFQKEFWHINEEGIFEVRAGVQGSGSCQRLTSNPVEEVPYQMVPCWRGEIRSEPVRISVSEPANSVDKEALGYVLGTRLGKLGKVLRHFQNRSNT